MCGSYNFRLRIWGPRSSTTLHPHPCARHRDPAAPRLRRGRVFPARGLAGLLRESIAPRKGALPKLVGSAATFAAGGPTAHIRGDARPYGLAHQRAEGLQAGWLTLGLDHGKRARFR